VGAGPAPWEDQVVRTVGIDLAAQPADTGVCIVDWDQRRIERVWANTSAGGDLELVDVMVSSGVAKVGIDTPLGWPDAFVAAVWSHHHGGPWPDVDAAVVDPAGHRRSLRLRQTDVAVAALTGRHPMSVSADRIAVAAMRAAVLQHLVAQPAPEADGGDQHDDTGHRVIDRSGMAGLVAEVYPAAALAVWGLGPTGYKGSGEGPRTRREELLGGVAAVAGVEADDDHVAAMVASDHLLDAFICAVVAAAVVAGETVGPTDDQLDAARREGWIHVPAPSAEPG